MGAGGNRLREIRGSMVSRGAGMVKSGLRATAGLYKSLHAAVYFMKLGMETTLRPKDARVRRGRYPPSLDQDANLVLG